MKSVTVAVVLVTVSLILKRVTAEQAVTTMDCMARATPGKPTEIKCTVHGQVKNGITWSRPDASQVAICSLKHSCINLTAGYFSVIDSAKQYRLIIESFNPTNDAGEWMCADGTEGISASCVKLQKYSPPDKKPADGACIEKASPFVIVSCAVAITATIIHMAGLMFATFKIM